MHPKPGRTFEELILGCCKQDRECQRLLYRQFYAYSMSICIRYTGDEDEAIQVLNDGFLKVFRHIKRYDTNRPFKAWLRAILVNTALNHLRRRKKYKFQVDMEDPSAVSVREDILSKISYRELIAMVQSLSTAYRTVFNLYVIDGYKHEEIADMLGIAVGTSKSNLSKAREKLREMIIENLGTKYA